MRLIFALLLILAVVGAAYASGGNPFAKICDPTDPEFIDRHEAYAGQVTINENQGWGWIQETAIVAPVPTENGIILTEVARYTWYHHVKWSDELCAFVETQMWPKYVVDAVTYAATFVGWGIQQVEVGHKAPAFRMTNGNPLADRALSEYTVRWMTPYLFGSVSVMNTDVYESALGPSTMAHSWIGKDDGQPKFFGKIQNHVYGEYRTYTYAIPIEFVPGNAHSRVDVLVSIYSRAGLYPQEILDAMAWFNSVKDLENPPLTPDPEDYTGALPPVFIYSPPAQKRSENGSPAVPANTHGAPFPIVDAESYNRAIEFFAAQE